MKILSLTAGAGNMYCGSCLHDNSLAAELLRQGHDVTLLPLYTPPRTEEASVSAGRVFFGGISVYMAERFPLFRRLPRALNRVLDAPKLISAFAGHGVETDPRLLGRLTVSLLRGESGHHGHEIRKLAGWLRAQPLPDVVTLPYTLLIALAEPLRRELDRPVTCSLQGEEFFLEGLQEPWKSEALALIRAQVGSVDAFVAVSRYCAGFMSRYLGIPDFKIHVVPLGIRLAGHGPRPPREDGEYRIGFLGRVAPEKGLHLLAEAYRLLRAKEGLPRTRLVAAGYLPPEHRGYLEEVRRTMDDGFEYLGELDRESKIAFLKSLDVFSLPCTYDEPKGLPVIEAMANGVPVVQPRRGSFPEMLAECGGGLLVEPDSAEALAAALAQLATDRDLAASLGRQGFQAVHRGRGIDLEAASTVEVYRSLHAARPT